MDEGGAGLKVDSGGHATLIDAVVALNIADDNLAPTGPAIGGGIQVDPGGILTMQGDAAVVGNQLGPGSLGAGGICVASGGTAILEDASMVGLPLLSPNVGSTGAAGGAWISGVLEVHDDATISGNIAGSGAGGGGIFVYGGVARLYDSALVGSNAAWIGGGIAVNGGTLLAVGAPAVVIEGNSATQEGGGVRILGGSADLTLVELSSNVADACGGGISVWDGDLILTDVLLADNLAGTCGGGVDLTQGTVLAERTTVSGNTAGTHGGGVYAVGSGVSATFDECTIDGNDAEGDGGGLYVGHATSFVGLYEGGASGNEATRGGGVFVDAGEVSLVAFDLTANVAGTEGGALRQRGDSTVDIQDGRVQSNSAGTMGGAFAISGGRTDLLHVDLIGNSAGTDGGAMALAFEADVWSEECWFHDNVAGARGGGIAVLSSGPNTDPQLTVVGNTGDCARPLAFNEYCSELRGNTASTDGGGGIFMEDGTAAVVSTALIGNDAATQGSAIGMTAHPTNGGPAMTAWNLLSVGNGTSATVDVIRLQDGLFVGEHVTSADNVGVPLRFRPGAAGSVLRRSIVWDTTLARIDPSLTVDATCTMFRAAPIGGATTGPNRAFGLDPFFTTTARGDYRLDAGSVNAVDQCDVGLPFDLDGAARTFPFDRGAFEAP